MSTENEQKQAVEFLESGAAFGASSAEVERIDTHISLVFLCGETVFKLKRAVAYPYVDFSTLERRRSACEREIELNRRTAPEIYLRTRTVTRDDRGGLQLDGRGETVECLVEMRRFDGETLFSRMAGRGDLNAGHMQELAAEIARFHAEAEVLSNEGGAAAIEKIIDGNARSFSELPDGYLDAGAVDRLNGRARDALGRVAGHLDRRRTEGRVRRCHGDLHLRNICLWRDRPTLFDAIEFNPELAAIDVFYDLAFLLMDLEHRQLRDLANVVLNRYLEITDDRDGLELLDLFMSLRAAVRAHVTANVARTADGDPGAIGEAQAYLELAGTLLAPAAPQLVATGGLSGTGKSTLARAIAPGIGPAPGAVILRSDVIRKQLARVAETERLSEEFYSSRMTRRVYRTMFERAAECLRNGRSVVLDAVFGSEKQRAAARRVADEAGVAFVGLWLDAPLPELEARVDARHGDASDATAEIVRRQARNDVGQVDWSRIDASGGVCETARRARARLAAQD